MTAAESEGESQRVQKSCREQTAPRMHESFRPNESDNLNFALVVQAQPARRKPR